MFCPHVQAVTSPRAFPSHLTEWEAACVPKMSQRQTSPYTSLQDMQTLRATHGNDDVVSAMHTCVLTVVL